MSFVEYLSDGFDRLGTLLPLAVIPFLATFLYLDNIRKAMGTPGTHLGVTFHFPTALPTFWTFVSLPNATTGIHVSPTVYFAPIYVVAESVLTAGFLGSIREAVETERYDFAGNVRTYVRPLLGYTILVWTVLFAAFSVGVMASPLIIIALLALLVLGFAFYGVPFLIVVDDCSLGEAFRESYELAVGNSNYAAFGVGYLVFVSLASIVGTVFINLGIPGIVLGAVCFAPVALALTVATVEFFVDLRSRSATRVESAPTDRFDY